MSLRAPAALHNVATSSGSVAQHRYELQQRYTAPLQAPTALHNAAASSNSTIVASSSSSNSSAVAPQRQQRCALQRHRYCSVASDNAAIAGPWFIRRTSVRPTAALRPARLPSCCHTSCCLCALTSYALLSYVLHIAVLHPIVLRPAFSSNIYLTFVQYLCVTGHSQQRILFFKLYVVLGFCS